MSGRSRGGGGSQFPAQGPDASDPDLATGTCWRRRTREEALARASNQVDILLRSADAGHGMAWCRCVASLWAGFKVAVTVLCSALEDDVVDAGCA